MLGLCQQLGVIFHMLGKPWVFCLAQKHFLPMEVFCSLNKQPGKMFRARLIISLDNGILNDLPDCKQMFMVLVINSTPISKKSCQTRLLMIRSC